MYLLQIKLLINLDSTCVLIGLQVCFHSAMKHENDVSQCGWLSPSCENLRASYILFLFVETENSNFIKEIKHVVRASIAWWRPRQSLWEFSSRWKPSTAFRVFTDQLSNSPKRSPRFSPGYEEGTEYMFYFLNRLFYVINYNCMKRQPFKKSRVSCGYSWSDSARLHTTNMIG